MMPIDTRIVERIASVLRNGDADAARMLLTEHPECRAFLDLGESLTGEYQDSLSGSPCRIDSWLDYAEAHGHRELRSMLGRDCWDPIHRDIYEAIRLGRLDQLQQLFHDHPRYVDGIEGGISSWLDSAVHYDQFKIAEVLAGMGADVNARRRFGSPPLSTAVGFAGPQMVEYLLSRGADPNGERERPIIGAINREPEDLALRLVQLLVEHGADVNREYTVYGDKENTFTALEWAEGKPNVGEYLRSKGAVERKAKPRQKTRRRDLAEEIVAYFEEYFGRPQPQAQIEIVPTEPPIAIHLIPAAENRNHVTLFTTGVSEREMAVPGGTDDYRFSELFIQLPSDWPTDKKSLASSKHGWPINWLRSIAKYPHQHQTWLGGPVTIIANGEPPEPLAPSLKFTSLLVMADRKFTAHDGRTIYLYRLLPLYTEERNFELEHGIAALMRALDKHDIPSVVDLNRRNVGLAE